MVTYLMFWKSLGIDNKKKTVKETLHQVISRSISMMQSNYIDGCSLNTQKASLRHSHLSLVLLTNYKCVNILKNEMQYSVLSAGTLHLQNMEMLKTLVVYWKWIRKKAPLAYCAHCSGHSPTWCLFHVAKHVPQKPRFLGCSKIFVFSPATPLFTRSSLQCRKKLFLTNKSEKCSIWVTHGGGAELAVGKKLTCAWNALWHSGERLPQLSLGHGLYPIGSCLLRR